ncbi:MAG TPA: zf-TFIIB domain-containing protein [Acidimicrobiales bacterium]|nr:zf-TFIIB domain-containing protein [Acidimicrobiales bacterium]
MRCPVDEEVLQISERQGVEIDYCPRCRGVWLDRGELDKILDRVDDDDDDRPRRGDRERSDRDRDDRDRDWDDRDRSDRPYKKKKSSFLSEIFEMGG